MTELSIIVPVYQVEQYVRQCMESIFKQGLDDSRFEVIIVNDGTKDQSIDVIQDIVDQHNNTTIVNQENQGLSMARNNGLTMAKGEYVLMPDSDDMLIENSLSKLLDVAFSTNADLIVADFLEMTTDEINMSLSKDITQKDGSFVEKTGKQLFLEDLNPHQCYVWRTLYKRQFLLENKLHFIRGIYMQDVPFTHECYLRASRCVKISWLLNIYRKGHESISYIFNMKKAKDYCIVIAKTWELAKMEDLTPIILRKLHDDVFTSFSAMLCISCHSIVNKSQRIEIIDYLKQTAPDLQFKNGCKQKFSSFLLKHSPHTLMHLRYLYAQLFENHILPFFRHHVIKCFRLSYSQ